tara:strand:+ start:303 stop:779 length:477 start_codon:yes stop_codon:yes gene_type:complete
MNADSVTDMTSKALPSVLIVDDSAALRGALRAVLGALGVTRIAEAANAMDAINVLRSGEISLTITDWKMEPMDGLTLLKSIREGAVGPNRSIPVIMLTAYNDPRYQAEALRAGASVFLSKPFTAASLVDALDAVQATRSPITAPQTGSAPTARAAAQA